MRNQDNFVAKKPTEMQTETTIKIEGCDSYEDACRTKNCLAYYGKVLSEIKKNTHLSWMYFRMFKLFQSSL